MGQPEKAPSLFVREATGLDKQLSSRDALMFNLLNMGIAWPLLFMFFAGAAYQGVNIAITPLLMLPAVIVSAATFYMLSAAFPRTGGDYVWVSRIIHPAVGFMENFALAFFFLSFIGVGGGWVVTYGLNIMFINLSIVTGNSAYLSLSAQVSTQTATLIISLLVLAAVAGVNVVGVKRAFRLQWVLFGIVIVGLVAYGAILLNVGPGGFKSNFNSMSGANYDAIIAAADKTGFITSFTLTGTLLGSIFTFLNYYGFNYSTFFAGEVKGGGRAQLYPIIGSTLIFALITSSAYGVAYYVMGGQFINAASLLAGSGNSAYTLPAPPIGDYLIIFASQSPITAILLPLTIIAATIGGIFTVFVVCVRMIFAWSFDRVIPTKFSEVDQRNGSPNPALALVTVLGVIYIIINVYAANVLTLLSYESSGIWLSAAVVGVAAIILPYKRKDLFAKSPSPTNKMIGGIPLVAILGVLTTIVGISVAIANATPTFTGSPINPIYILGLALSYIIGLVVYLVVYGYRRSQGINLGLTFTEIPPE